MTEELSWGSELDPLCIEYNTWCVQNGYPPQSADELVYDLQIQLDTGLRKASASTGQLRALVTRIEWLLDFRDRWEAAEKRQTEIDENA